MQLSKCGAVATEDDVAALAPGWYLVLIGKTSARHAVVVRVLDGMAYVIDNTTATDGVPVQLTMGVVQGLYEGRMLMVRRITCGC